MLEDLLGEAHELQRTPAMAASLFAAFVVVFVAGLIVSVVGRPRARPPVHSCRMGIRATTGGSG